MGCRIQNTRICMNMSLKVCFLPTISSFPSFRDLEKRNVTAVYHKPHETTCWLATLSSHTYPLPFSVGPSHSVSCMQNANTYIFNFSVFYLKKLEHRWILTQWLTYVPNSTLVLYLGTGINRCQYKRKHSHVETRFHSLADLYWECIFICWFG